MAQSKQRGNNQEDGKHILKNDKLNNPAISTAEKTLLRIVLEYPQVLAEVEKSGGGELFGEKLLKEIYQVNLAMYQAGHNIKASDLIAYLDVPEGQQLLSQILLENQLIAEDWERALRDCLILLELEVLNKKIHEKSQLMSHLDGRGEATQALDLMAQIQKLVLEKQRLAAALRKGGNSLEN